MDNLPLISAPLLDPASKPASASINAGIPGQLATTSATLFQLLCTMAGTGILQLPFTIAQGGWAALLLVVIVGIMTNWTGKLLIQSLYLNPAGYERIPGYPEIGEGTTTARSEAKITVAIRPSYYPQNSAQGLL